MANLREVYKTKKTNAKKTRTRKRFIAVDVWQKHFGPVSERAVYDIFSQRFNIERHNMNKYSFSHCLNALRKIDNREHEAPKYGTSLSS